MNNFLLIFNKLLLTVLLLIHLTHFSYAQSCSGNNHANNANGCDDSGNKYDYSFDGMPKPSNWRELDEYQYLLLEVGDDAASAPAPPQRRHERRQVEEQEHEAHTFQEYGGGEHSSGESLDDFESWEKEMAEADNIREESFLESKVGRVVLASVAGIVFTIALLQLKSSAGDSDNNEKNIKNDKKEKKKKKDKKGTSTDEEDDNKKGLKKEKLDDDSSKSKMKSKKKKGKEKKSTADKAKDDTDVQVKKKEVRDDDDGFVLVKKEEEEEEEKMSNKKKKKKKKKKKAPKID